MGDFLGDKIGGVVASRFAPWVVALVLFFGVSSIFYAPQFEGKSLAQGDIAQYAGMSQDIKEHRATQGEDPQWTGGMFSGMPAYLIDVEYPTQVVKRAASRLVRLLGDPMNMTFMAMLMMMIAVVLMGVNPWIGIIAGLAYGLSTYFFLIIDAGHITKMWALVYAPPLIGAVWYSLKRNIWLGASLAALFGSLELGANHPQITYYFLLVCVALWLSELIAAVRGGAVLDILRRTLILAIAAIVALGSNIAPLWYTMEHQKHTTRGVSEVADEAKAREEKIAYNTAWSYGIAESCNMLVPNYMGSWSGDVNEDVVAMLSRRGVENELFDLAIQDIVNEFRAEGYSVSAEDIITAVEEGDSALGRDIERRYTAYAEEAWGYASNYWGGQPYTAGPTYLGAVALMLALLALMLYEWRTTAWIVIISLVAVVMAWGANVMGVYELLFDYLPAYKSFRTVSMALVVVEWSVPLLAAMAIYRLVKSDLSRKALVCRILTAFGVVAVAIVAMVLTADYGVGDIYSRFGEGLWVEQLRSAAYEGRHAALVGDAWRTMLFVAMATAVMLLYAYRREAKAYSGVVMAVALGALVVWDLAGVAKRYIYEDKWNESKPTEHVATEADKYILTDKDLGFRVLDLSGDPFNSARASYFHRSVGGYHGAKLGRYQDVIEHYLRSMDGEVLAMLNTRYVIYEGEAYPAEALTGVEPFGAAWFVEEVSKVSSASEALDMLGYELLDECAIVEGGEALADSYDAGGEIELVEYAPNRLVYEYTAPERAFAVFSEVYFPEGWSVEVDGKPMEYYATDYVLRGMELPAGSHSVVWSFRAPRWGVMSGIMAICSVVVLFFAGGAIYLLLTKRNSDVE